MANYEWLRSVFGTEQWRDDVQQKYEAEKTRIEQNIPSTSRGTARYSQSIERDLAQVKGAISNALYIEYEVVQRKLELDNPNRLIGGSEHGYLKGINVDDDAVRNNLSNWYGVNLPSTLTRSQLSKIREYGYEQAVILNYVPNPNAPQTTISPSVETYATTPEPTITPPIIPEFEILPQAQAEKEPLITSWYWIKKPSGQIEYVKISEKLKQVYLDKGYIVSRSRIEQPQPEPTPEPQPQPEPQPVPTITPPIVIAQPVPQPTVDDSINTNMVTQQVIDFNIINGRAVGSIKFVATDSFNPYYYNKEIINLVQFKTPNGATLLVKQNRLRFTSTERDEIIHYDENASENTRLTLESYVWEWMDKPAGAFSKPYVIEISEAEPPKPSQLGFMGAGVAGAIGLLILGGFLMDSRGKK